MRFLRGKLEEAESEDSADARSSEKKDIPNINSSDTDPISGCFLRNYGMRSWISPRYVDLQVAILTDFTIRVIAKPIHQRKRCDK